MGELVITYRNAELRDVDTIVSLATVMFKESQFNQYNFNHQKVTDLITCLINENQIVIVAETKHGEMIGAFVGAVMDHFFGDTLMAFDYGLFVTEEYRQGQVGLNLVREYIAWATALGADEITIGNSTGVESDRVVEMYEYAGFIKYGSNMRMRVEKQQ